MMLLAQRLLCKPCGYNGPIALLMHMNGADGSPNFVDETGKIITANGNAHIKTDQSKFGGSSAYFDGDADYLTVASHPLLDFGLLDFMISAFVRAQPNGLAISTVLYANGFYLNARDGYAPGNVASVVFNSSTRVLTGSNLEDSQWHHLALSRESGVFRLFIDGAKVSEYTGSQAIDLRGLVIGSDYGQHAAVSYKGYIDELIIVRGSAVYTTNFTPPTAPFTL